ncbi:hypothetical protein BDQ12DRAFT_729328 [Crucibulum laeve]|uniref:Uncharacterized protein n=1 Tax=Crucibulum laeve TaxID=68775 RepID=A0A5C3LFP1_9AGAR|nr:hypothetical protein BDQ12DRAFT_729328 [Crucibulum laeve]
MWSVICRVLVGSEVALRAGTDGFCLFNFVFSCLPKKVQSLVGFLVFKHDQQLVLRALAVLAAKNDVHRVFLGLVLMTISDGWTADLEGL